MQKTKLLYLNRLWFTNDHAKYALKTYGGVDCFAECKSFNYSVILLLGSLEF